MTTNIQNNEQLPTILATLLASIASYGHNGIVSAMTSAGWLVVPRLDEDTNEPDHYHGIAFYRSFDGATEIIIANRGSTSIYDFAVTDALLAINAVPEADPDALLYYNAVVDWARRAVPSGGTVKIIETGHSLGGHEADYVVAKLLADATSPPTSAVTFDAPGQSTTVARAGATYDALNISLNNELVHRVGAVFNAGYLGSEVTIGGGVHPVAVAVTTGLFNPGLGLLGLFASGLYYNHATDRLTNYFAKAPALGGVNLKTYSPTQVSQSAATAMEGISAFNYNKLSPQALTQLYQALVTGSPSGAPPTESALKETFTIETTPTGFILHGSKGDTLTATISGTHETLQDGKGNELVLTLSSAGTDLVSASYTVGDPTTGTVTFSPGRSSVQTMTYDSGAYATSTDDGWGNITTDYYTRSGVHYASDWAHSDGTSGAIQFAPNGLTAGTNGTPAATPGSEQVVNPDGSWFDVATDSLDTTTITNFSANGTQTGQTVQAATSSDYTAADIDNSKTVSSTVTTPTGVRQVTSYSNSQGLLLKTTWTSTDGSSGTDIFHASGLKQSTVTNADGTKDTINTWPALFTGGAPSSDTTQSHFNADGTLAGDTWQLNDGASGHDSFHNGAGTGTITHADGSLSTLTVTATGNITVDNLDKRGAAANQDWWHADGTHGITVYDAAGNVAEEFTYQVNGQVIDIIHAQDGTVAGESTVSVGELLNPDGSRFAKAADANGGIDITYWDSNGDATVFQYVGDTLSSVDHVSITGKGTQGNAHNPFTITFTHPDGTTITEYLNGANRDIGGDWTKPDGSHGADIVNADGSQFGERVNADGTSSEYAKDSQGNLYVETFDANAIQTGDEWNNADGSHGSDNYGGDGSSSGRSYDADGSSSAYADDGHGNSQWFDYSAAAVLLDDQWDNADGSGGDDIFHADGSSEGDRYRADGSATTYTDDGHATRLETNFNAAGAKRATGGRTPAARTASTTSTPTAPAPASRTTPTARTPRTRATATAIKVRWRSMRPATSCPPRRRRTSPMAPIKCARTTMPAP